MDLAQHLRRQIAFSRGTFGPDERREMVIDHIRKELVEVEETAPTTDKTGAWGFKGCAAANEWTDVVILALDGMTRSLIASGMTHDQAADFACVLIVEKQSRNELRTWPDWRTAPVDRAIEHISTRRE